MRESPKFLNQVMGRAAWRGDDRATASGQRTKSEVHGYGQNEFVPWQLGAVM